MKKKLITITLLIAVSSLNAQDKSCFKDGFKTEDKTSVISEPNVQYKKINKLSDLIFETDLSNINMEIYKEGPQQRSNEKVSETGRESRKNRASLETTPFLPRFKSSVSYEFINNDGSKGIEIPLNVYSHNREEVTYSLGVNLKFYHNKQGEGFYYGPSFELGELQGWSSKTLGFIGLKTGYQLKIRDFFGINLAGSVGTISDLTFFDIQANLNFGINYLF